MSRTARRSTAARAATVAVAALFLLGVATPALAASTSVQVDAALTDQTRTDELSFTFTASSNQTVTATSGFSRAGGNVQFQFDRWERTDGGGSGSSNSWQVVSGGSYRVTYEVTVTGDVDDTTYSGTVEVSGGAGTEASEQLSVNVDVLYPQFGSIGAGNPTFVFDDGSGSTQTQEFDVTVENTGQGVMVLSDVTFSNVPSGFSVTAVDVPNTIAANSQGTVTVRVEADSSVSSGSHSFTMNVADNLDSVSDASSSISVDVRKPPVADVSGSEINVGDVLVGTSKSTEFTVNEVGGYSGIDGVSIEVVGNEQSGSVSFSGSVSTSAGGSDTASVTVRAAEGAAQHSTLSWDVEITPYAEYAPTRTVTVTARVIHPAKLQRVGLNQVTVPFDQPRSEVSTFTEESTVDIVNSGDLEMNVQSASASMQSGGQYLSASVENVPSTVGGLSTGEATLVVEADADAPEGTHTVQVTVDTESAGTKTITRSVTISQQPSLGVQSTVQYGEVTVTENRTQSIDVAEQLGYESITGLQIQKVSGPNKWLTVVERPPSRIEPGQVSPLVVALRFDTQAELYKQYRWKFRVSADNVPTKTITVVARPKPYSFDQITQPLSDTASQGGWQAATTRPMNQMLLLLEERLKGDGAVAGDDLSRALAGGRAALLFVDSLERARTARQQGNYSEAQRALARAAVARDLLAQYVNNLQGDKLQSTASPAVAAANEAFAATAAKQRSHYEEVLAANESVIRNAQAHRALMRLAEYTGNSQQAQTHREAYQRASEKYLRLVEHAANSSARAQVLWSGFRDNATLVIADYPLVLNPARVDSVYATTNRVESLFSEAASTYARAGATDEAAATRQRASAVSSRIQAARYSLLGASAVYGAAFLLLLVRIGRNTYAYVRDADAATTGDFLLQT
ncbi:hypothetical protein [Halobaculum sp. P14]|uniref:hypothetical protein n=1 Tax=Halobaculum sp. P14 TaxID=3421638 RepID=UPI003EBBB1F3